MYININKENIQNFNENFRYDRISGAVVTEYMFNVTTEFLEEFAEEPINYQDASEVEYVINYNMFEECIGENKITVFDEEMTDWGGYSDKYDVTFVGKFLKVECDRVFFEILIEEQELVR